MQLPLMRLSETIFQFIQQAFQGVVYSSGRFDRHNVRGSRNDRESCTLYGHRQLASYTWRRTRGAPAIPALPSWLLSIMLLPHSWQQYQVVLFAMRRMPLLASVAHELAPR